MPRSVCGGVRVLSRNLEKVSPMKIKIEIALENAAFADDGAEEIRRILNRLCDQLPSPLDETDGAINLRDINGNGCGAAQILEELTEAEETRRGELLCQVLHLRKDRENPRRYLTTWGSKTQLGIFRAVARIVTDGK